MWEELSGVSKGNACSAEIGIRNWCAGDGSQCACQPFKSGFASAVNLSGGR
jgi:hypothetical protein